MQSVSMLQAKSSLSRLVEAIEQGQEREIVIARFFLSRQSTWLPWKSCARTTRPV